MTVIPGDQRPLADVLAELERSHGRVDIAQGGHTVAALVSAEYLESLEETIAVATDAETRGGDRGGGGRTGGLPGNPRA